MTKEKLHELLRAEYSRNKWKEVINAIFPNRNFFATEEPVNMTKQAQRDSAQKIIRFGIIKLDDGHSLSLFEVELKTNATQITRNRVGLRNLITTEVIPGVADGALIIYHQPGHGDWRFSFYSKSIYWDDDGQEVKKETHPKRYTYVLGKGETCVTPKERLWHLAEKRTRTIKDILEAFSVEKVSKEFFIKYKKHYQAFVESLMVSNFKASLFNGNEKAIRDFVKKMLGRIVFLQFLQKKGWLDVPLGKPYGEGNKNFLAEFFETNKTDVFYTTCLVPLFFETLNNPKDEIFKVTNTKFPYLNGGLFEKDEIEKKAKADYIIFKKELFDHLFSFFGEYNFTIDESTPDDLDVGIDPEMLGHIFENLLEDNHEKGAFYTPKLIVQYMCQEVLIQYLELHLGKHEAIAKFIRYKDRGDEKSKDNFIHQNATKIEKLLDDVKICDPAIGSGAFPMGLLQEVFHAKLTLDWTLFDKKGEVKRGIIQNSIYGVDKDKGAVDIARLRFWLSLIVDEEVKKGEKPQPLPNFDYKIMQGDSLLESFKGYSLKYHDIQEEQQPVDLFNNHGQVNIFKNTHTDLAALEKDFFDPENNHRKEEIRNKIDALVAHSIEQSFKDLIDEKKETVDSVSKIIATDRSKKARQEKNIARWEAEIEDMQQALRDIKPLLKKDEKPWFMWHLYFKDVFDKGGFDIVIGNPPYIRQESITDIKPYLEKVDDKPNYEVYNSTSDIYTYFFELGHKILKPDKGVFSYICSKQYTRGRFGQKLREYLINKSIISGYIDFNKVQVFGATVDTSVIFFQKRQIVPEKYSFLYCPVGNEVQKNNPLIDYVEKNGWFMEKDILKPNSWSFAPKNETEIIRRIELINKKLIDYGVKINLGIKTGFNDAFYLDEQTRETLIKSDPKNKDLIVKLLRGRNIKRYAANFANTWLLNTHNGYKDIPAIEVEKDFPKVLEYLKQFQLQLEKRGDKGRHWSNLRNCTYIDDFLQPKITWITLSDKANFLYDEEGYFVNNSAYFFTGKNLKYFTALLNSKLVEWYFNYIATHSGVGTNRWEKTYVEQIPVPDIPKPEMKPFEILVDYITFIRKYPDRISPYTPNEHMAANFEELTDACVYELYFKKHMQEKGITVLKEVTELLQPIDHLDETAQAEKIIKIINFVYDNYKSTDNIIRRRIEDFPVKSPDIINIIQNG